MDERPKLTGFERALQITGALFKLAFTSEPKTFAERAPVIRNHIEQARRATSRLSLVNHATAAYGMIMAGGKDAEHIERIKTEGAFEGYLMLLREVADEPRISEGLAYSYGRNAAENSFVNQSNMFLSQVKKVSSLELRDRFFGAYGNCRIPSSSLVQKIIDASPEETEAILRDLPSQR